MKRLLVLLLLGALLLLTACGGGDVTTAATTTTTTTTELSTPTTPPQEMFQTIPQRYWVPMQGSYSHILYTGNRAIPGQAQYPLSETQSFDGIVIPLIRVGKLSFYDVEYRTRTIYPMEYVENRFVDPNGVIIDKHDSSDSFTLISAKSPLYNFSYTNLTEVALKENALTYIASVMDVDLSEYEYSIATRKSINHSDNVGGFLSPEEAGDNHCGYIVEYRRRLSDTVLCDEYIQVHFNQSGDVFKIINRDINIKALDEASYERLALLGGATSHIQKVWDGLSDYSNREYVISSIITVWGDQYVLYARIAFSDSPTDQWGDVWTVIVR